MLALAACTRGNPAITEPPPLADWDGGPPPQMYDANVPNFCDLPGSVRFDGKTKDVVPGAKGLPDLSWMDVPAGFCAHFYALAPNARSLRFAPGGELFVTSPTRGTTGGGPGGKGAILVMPDDDRNGIADGANAFLSSIDATQGILFANGFFYYQDDARILKVAYTSGDRSPKASPIQVADLSTRYKSSIHWAKTMDMADDGTIYIANGSDQGEETSDCLTSRPFRGGIFAIDNGSPSDGKPIAKGFRNPIFLRCQKGHNLCLTSELTRDYSWKERGREKLVPIREGDDWGFPCCASRGTAFSDLQPVPDCNSMSDEKVAFYVADTPFGFDFEPGRWPVPWTNRIFVALHGQFGTWIGARIVAIETDPQTGMPLPGGTIKPDGTQGITGAAMAFANGWDDGKLDHGRPSDVTFAPDGRMFVSQDNGPTQTGDVGIVVWFAPLDLPKPQ
jgi:glucose/arabinose dehydrogenase